MGANIKTGKMGNNRHQRQRGEKDRSKWDVMSEAERELLRDLWRKRETEKDFFLMVTLPSIYLFSCFECEHFFVAFEATRTCGQTSDWTCITKTGHRPIICSNAT